MPSVEKLIVKITNPRVPGHDDAADPTGFPYGS
jgi:hypothetical protein